MTPKRVDGTVRVLTVDDQAAFRDAARVVIEATPGFEQIGEAASGEEAIALVGRLDPELVLMDVRMPGIDGIETTRRIAATHAGTVIVLVTVDDLASLPPDAGTCGAVAQISKSEFGRVVLERVWALHERRTGRPPH
jgi:two-component system invasion response regulator UvrY